MSFLEPLKEGRNFGIQISPRGHGEKAQRPRREFEIFSVPSAVKWFDDSRDETLRELCVKRP
jgi:hypothetical protein